MTATLLDQVTTLRRPPARIARDASNGHRQHGALDDSAVDASDADTPRPPARRSWVEQTTQRCGAPSYAAALVDIVPVLPTVATIFTVFAYVGIAGQMHQLPLLIGGLAALLIGLLTACLHRSLFTAAEQAHPRSFAEIRQRLDGLATQIAVLDADLPHDATASQRLALQEAVAHQRALERDLTQGGTQWVVGTGYVDAMTRLHRAEEALIAIQPAETVLAGALFDEVRIAGSTMTERDRLLGKLRTAVQSMRPSATAYLNESLPASVVSAPSPSAEPEARIVLREVRRALNDFRDESRARLIRSRGRLLGTITMTGSITYVLLVFAVSLKASHDVTLSDPVAAAAAIYLVGAVVGLFNRLHVESGDEEAGEDYGLSRTRLLLTPMLSGLAAVGGVLITGMLSGIVDVNAITPTRDVAVTLASGTSLPDAAAQLTNEGFGLRNIFNLREYPFALVLAAIFGLTPKSFLKRLQRASDQPRLDLKSTAAHLPADGSLDSPLAVGKG